VDNKSLRTVLLFNHASDTGHHESWMAIFASSLLARGYRVVCITPNPSTVQAILGAKGASVTQNLCLIALPELELPSSLSRRLKDHLKEVLRYVRMKLSSRQRAPELPSRTAMEAVIHKPTLFEKWRANAPLYATHSPLVQVTANMPVSLRFKRRILRAAVPPLWHTVQILRIPLRMIRKLRSSTTHTGTLHPAMVANAIRKALINTPWVPDFLLLMYHDLLMTKPRFWKGNSATIPIPWGGVRFDPFDAKHAGKEGYFQQAQFRGMCFLDERAVSAYEAADPSRCFIFLPDITNTNLPVRTRVIVKDVQRRAAGRKVVLMCGSIEGRKNVDAFCQLSQMADPGRWFFAILGQVHPHTFSQQDRDAIACFIGAQEKNTLYCDTFFPDERDMNAVIQAADILFAAYKNFRISSNMLGKAAYFEKPILVSQGFLMGERVSHYEIGLAVPQDDAKAMLRAIERLVAVQVPPKRFAAYRAAFSEHNAGDSLEDFLKRIAIS
jgi:glycosyltransferase involved in cell wall biosynthesis